MRGPPLRGNEKARWRKDALRRARLPLARCVVRESTGPHPQDLHTLRILPGMTVATSVRGLDEHRVRGRRCSGPLPRRRRGSAGRAPARARRLRARTGSSCCRRCSTATASSFRICPVTAAPAGCRRGAAMVDLRGRRRGADRARAGGPGARRGPLVRRARRAPARAAAPRARPRALLLVAPAGIGSTTRFARSRGPRAGIVRPGRWVAPFRHRYAERAWYRRAALPALVRLGCARALAAGHGRLSRGRDRARRTSAPPAARSFADDPRRDLEQIALPRRRSSGARATRSCRSTTRSSTRAGCVPSCASSRTAATS